MVITKIEHKFHEEPVEVYNLTVDGCHNYLITKYEMLVHNKPSITQGAINHLVGAYYPDGTECDVNLVIPDNFDELSNDSRAVCEEAQGKLENMVGVERFLLC